MDTKLEEMLKARSTYIELAKKELLGPGSEISIPDEEHELITNSPEKNYSIGILFPRNNKMNADNDDIVSIPNSETEEVPEDDSDVVVDEVIDSGDNESIIMVGDEDNLDEEIGLATQNMPSSMGITCFVKGNVETVHCKLEFATYRKALASDCRMPFFPESPDDYEVPDEMSGWIYYDKDERALRLKRGGLRRKDVSQLKEKTDSDPDDIIDKMFKLSNQLAKGWVREPHSANVNIRFDGKDYVDNNRSIDGTSAKITALRRKVGKDVYSLTIMLVNDSEDDAKGETCLYQPKVTINTNDNNFFFLTYSSLFNMENLDDEEKSLELQYRHKKVYSTGLGTSSSWEIDDEGKGYVSSDFFPEVEVPSMDFGMPGKYPVDSKTFSMKYLSDYNDISREEKLNNIKSVIDAYNDWIGDMSKELDDIPESLIDIAEKNIADCRKACDRMYSGLNTLGENDVAWNAFQLANRAMYMQRIHIVLQNKTSATDRYDEDEELQDLLDKIEADYASADSIDLLSKDKYSWRPFQLAFLVLSIDSIVKENGKDRELVDLIWFPTGGGKTEAYLGLTAFTIFYRRMMYPDSSGGTTVMMRYTLRLLAAQQFTRASTLICACELIRRDCCSRKPRYKRYSIGDEPITIGLWIGGDHTPNTNAEAGRELEELEKARPAYLNYAKDKHNKFQVLKCPWCGTKMVKDIDADGKRFLGSFGYRMNNKKHFQLYCTNQDCKFSLNLPIQIIDQELYDNPPTLLFGTVDKFAMMPWNDRIKRFFGIGTENRAPELIIQDELHLISGPLGTIVGLYETAIDTLCESKGTKSKIVASTATIRKAKEQCSALYNREVSQFPSPGLNAEDSFFAKEADIDYNEGKYGRKYIGVMPSGKTKALMEVRSISALMQGINRMELTDEAKDKLWTLTVYFNSLKDLGKCSTLISDDVISHIRVMASRTGSPSSGRKINSVDELTSRKSTTELNETLDKLEKRSYSSDDPNKNRGVSSVLIATNMISVGIDIARLNSMLMVGQPKLTSEYIQASSRVGRSFPGVVFAMYDGSKSRDRSHFEQFKSYHESFYKYVEPTGATPFSKPARDRAMHAVAITLMRYLIPELSDEMAAGKFSVKKYSDQIDHIAEIISQRSKDIANRLNAGMIDDSEEIKQELESVFDAWEVSVREYGEDKLAYGNKYMVKNPDPGNGRLLKVFNTSPKDTEPMDTMTSMRNVDLTVAANILVWE